MSSPGTLLGLVRLLVMSTARHVGYPTPRPSLTLRVGLSVYRLVLRLADLGQHGDLKALLGLMLDTPFPKRIQRRDEGAPVI